MLATKSKQTDTLNLLFDQLKVNEKFKKPNPVEYMRGYVDGVNDFATGKVKVK